MKFIDVIIDSVAKNGILELNKLSENPQLQNIYSGGIIELFGTETAKEIFSVLKDVNNSVAWWFINESYSIISELFFKENNKMYEKKSYLCTRNFSRVLTIILAKRSVAGRIRKAFGVKN